jgi:hypothetical protein
MTTFGFVVHTPQENQPLVEVNDYHLIFDLNGVLVATNEGQTKTHPMVLRFSLKEFFSTCVNFFIMYIWSSAMRRNFLSYLEIIVEKIGVLFLSSRIMD